LEGLKKKFNLLICLWENILHIVSCIGRRSFPGTYHFCKTAWLCCFLRHFLSELLSVSSPLCKRTPSLSQEVVYRHRKCRLREAADGMQHFFQPSQTNLDSPV